MKREKKSIFPEKKWKLGLVGNILWFLFLLVINWGLIRFLSRAGEFLAKLVPSNETWALAVMVIPITMFGIYISLLSSNYAQNKDMVTWGKTYGEIREKRFSENSFTRSLVASAVGQVICFVIYFVQLDYPMLIGTALILSVILFALTIFELIEGKKNPVDLYKEQFFCYLKRITEVLLFDAELNAIEKTLSKNDLHSAEKIFFAKCDFFDRPLKELEFELEQMPCVIRKKIWVSFIDCFSLDLKRIEDAIFYTRFVTEIHRVSIAQRSIGNAWLANEMLLHLAESWVKKVNDYSAAMNKGIKKYAAKAKKSPNGMVDFLKEGLRRKITFIAFLSIQEVILKAMNDVDDSKEEKHKTEDQIRALSDSMASFNKRFDEALGLLKDHFEISEEKQISCAEEV